MSNTALPEPVSPVGEAPIFFRPPDPLATECKPCDVPHCETEEIPTPMFVDTNITCMTCKKFHCSQCTKQIWTGNWNGETFYKPKILFAGMKHEVWRCAFCRSSFDRIVPDEN